MSMNKWFGMGRIVKDIDKRSTPSGVSVANFTIAVEDDYKPKDGSDRQVDFVDCVAWAGKADFAANYLGKGRNVVVIGPLKSEKYTDKDGNKRTAWKIKVDDIYFADSKRDGAAPAGQSYSSQSVGFSEPEDPDDGTLPF